MPFDTTPFHPPQPRPVSKYDHMRVMFDDGLCACMDTITVSGLTLNGVYPAPYFDPKRVYWIGPGQVHAMPETES